MENNEIYPIMVIESVDCCLNCIYSISFKDELKTFECKKHKFLSINADSWCENYKRNDL